MSEDQELAEAVVIGLGGYMPGDVVKCNAFGDGDIICRIEARLPSGSYKVRSVFQDVFYVSESEICLDRP